MSRDITYLNFYTCPKCEEKWDDLWFCEVDTECPNCHTLVTPEFSETTTRIREILNSEMRKK